MFDKYNDILMTGESCAMDFFNVSIMSTLPEIENRCKAIYLVDHLSRCMPFLFSTDNY